MNTVETSRSSSAFAGRRTKAVLAVSALVIFAALVGSIALARRNRPPLLTRQRFDQAMRQWELAAPSDYNIEVRVDGPQSAVYRVQVRKHDAVAAFRNDYPLKQRRTFSTWSVPGMFGTIETDVVNSEVDPQQSPPQRGAVRGGSLYLWADFDPRYGYPQRYRREEWGGPGDVSWEVTKFEVLAR